MHYHHLLATVRVVPYYLSGSHDAFRPWHKLTIISCYTYVFFCSLLHSCLLSRLPGYDCMNESRYNYPLASYFTYSGQQFLCKDDSISPTLFYPSMITESYIKASPPGWLASIARAPTAISNCNKLDLLLQLSLQHRSTWVLTHIIYTLATRSKATTS